MKKGYFFTLDAFIAMSVLIICVVLIFSIHSSTPYPLQSIFISDDMMYYLSSTKCYELQNYYVRSLITNGTIALPDSSLVEQMAVFYLSGRNGTARNFTRNVMGGMIPQKYGVQLRVYNSTKEYVDRLNEGSVNESDARLLITSKKIVFGLINETSWGPMTAEVRIWQ
jgi:hypothetical protein